MDVADILDALDIHGFEDIEETDKVAVINDVIQEINAEAPWPYLDTYEVIDASTADVNAATGEVTMTVAWTAIRYIQNATNREKRVRWVREDDLIEEGVDLTLQEEPTCFYFVGQELFLHPIPTSGLYRVGVVQVQADVTAASAEAAILLPPRHHRVILLGALFKLHSQEDDAENALMFKQQYDEKLVRMRADLFKQQYDRSDSMWVMGWGDYDGDA